MRRLSITLLFAACVLVFTTSTADARRRPKKASKFEANKTFGLGIMLGAPSGLSGKYYLSKDTALDFGIGAYYRYHRDHDGFHVHADFLWHPAVLAKADPFWLALYVGVGVRLINYTRGDHGHLGVRVPLGLLFDFEKTPIDIFVEFAFVGDFVPYGDRHDYGWFGLSFAVGCRYYF